MMSRHALHEIIASFADVPLLGEPVDQLEHALQTAGAALAAGAESDIVLAAALHDIGYTDLVRGRYPDLPHEESGARFVAYFASDRATWLVRAHVDAKRYLVFAEGHDSRLSPRSRTTLQHQGGPMDAREATAFEKHRWFAEAIALRRWDDAAKIPGGPAPTIGEIAAVCAQ